jgi:hypothetical protein
VAYVTRILLMTVYKMSVAFGVDQVIQICAEYVMTMPLTTVFSMNVVFGVEVESLMVTVIVMETS